LIPASAAALIFGGDLTARAGGLLGLAFFGGGGIYALRAMARTPWTIAFARDALEIRVEQYVSRIPWADIEAVGLITVAGQRMPAIRLSRYDRFLASFSPEAARAYTKRLSWLRWAARATQIAFAHSGLGGHAEAHRIEDFLRANRAMTGYDLSFSWNQLDRPARRFAEFLDREWRAHVLRTVGGSFD
jgi:hypothetical protein